MGTSIRRLHVQGSLTNTRHNTRTCHHHNTSVSPWPTACRILTQGTIHDTHAAFINWVIYSNSADDEDALVISRLAVSYFIRNTSQFFRAQFNIAFWKQNNTVCNENTAIWPFNVHLWLSSFRKFVLPVKWQGRLKKKACWYRLNANNFLFCLFFYCKQP